MNQNSKFACFSGSFTPFHRGHLHVINKALKEFDFIYLLISINPDKKYRLGLLKKIKIYIILKRQKIKNVKIKINKGLTVIKAKELNSKYLIRGYRDQNDLAYEKWMLDVNKKIEPTIKTILYCSNKECKKIRSSSISQ